MSAPPALDYIHSTYLSITFPPTSPYYSSPDTFSLSTPITHVSQIGELKDSHVYRVGVEKDEWEGIKDRVMQEARGVLGVAQVKELVPAQRAKRGGGGL
jgi:hypothetical protein